MSRAILLLSFCLAVFAFREAFGSRRFSLAQPPPPPPPGWPPLPQRNVESIGRGDSTPFGPQGNSMHSTWHGNDVERLVDVRHGHLSRRYRPSSQHGPRVNLPSFQGGSGQLLSRSEPSDGTSSSTAYWRRYPFTELRPASQGVRQGRYVDDGQFLAQTSQESSDISAALPIADVKPLGKRQRSEIDEPIRQELPEAPDAKRTTFSVVRKFQEAIDEGDTAEVERLLTRESVTAAVLNDFLKYALRASTWSQNYEIPALFLQAGAYLDTTVGVTPGGMALIHYAVNTGSEILLRRVLETGANPNTLHQGDTPLYRALAMGQTKLAHLLLDRGAMSEWPNGSKIHAPPAIELARGSGDEVLLGRLLHLSTAK